MLQDLYISPTTFQLTLHVGHTVRGEDGAARLGMGVTATGAPLVLLCGAAGLHCPAPRRHLGKSEQPPPSAPGSPEWLFSCLVCAAAGKGVMRAWRRWARRGLDRGRWTGFGQVAGATWVTGATRPHPSTPVTTDIVSHG